MLISAGTIFWPRAWLYLGPGILLFAINAVVASRRNLQMIVERRRKRSDMKTSDKVLTSGITITSIAMWIAAGIDTVRFGRSMTSHVTLAAGAALHLTGMAVIGWSPVINPSTGKERAHPVRSQLCLGMSHRAATVRKRREGFLTNQVSSPILPLRISSRPRRETASKSLRCGDAMVHDWVGR